MKTRVARFGGVSPTAGPPAPHPSHPKGRTRGAPPPAPALGEVDLPGPYPLAHAAGWVVDVGGLPSRQPRRLPAPSTLRARPAGGASGAGRPAPKRGAASRPRRAHPQLESRVAAGWERGAAGRRAATIPASTPRRAGHPAGERKSNDWGRAEGPLSAGSATADSATEQPLTEPAPGPTAQPLHSSDACRQIASLDHLMMHRFELSSPQGPGGSGLKKA